jgi:hypothetical protein
MPASQAGRRGFDPRLPLHLFTIPPPPPVPELLAKAELVAESRRQSQRSTLLDTDEDPGLTSHRRDDEGRRAYRSHRDLNSGLRGVGETRQVRIVGGKGGWSGDVDADLVDIAGQAIDGPDAGAFR